MSSYLDLGDISSTNANTVIGDAWDAINVYNKTVVGRFAYYGTYWFIGYKYSGSQYGIMIAQPYHTPNMWTLSVNNYTKTIGKFTCQVL